MSPSPGRPADWRLSDEWFSAYLADLEGSGVRLRRLRREGRVPIPAKDELSRVFQDKTEQLCRLLAVERRRPAVRKSYQDSSVSGGSFVLEEGMK